MQSRKSWTGRDFGSRPRSTSLLPRHKVQSPNLHHGMHFRNDVPLFNRRDDQDEFVYNDAILMKDRQLEAKRNSATIEPQMRAQSVPPGARSRREMFNSAGLSPTILDYPRDHEMAQRILKQAAFQRKCNTPDPRTYAGPSEREIFLREKYLFLKERAIFLRERQSFIIEKELFLMEKRELLRRFADKTPPAPAKSSQAVRSKCHLACTDVMVNEETLDRLCFVDDRW